MKLGIAGCGMIVHGLLSFIHEVEEIELTALTSIPAEYEKVKELAQQHNIKKTYKCYSDMLDDKDIEFIYLGTPNHLHFEMTKEALLKGKHVICEKPFTSNYKEMKELITVSKTKNLMLFEAVTTHYLPNFLKIKEFLPQLGDIKIVSANYSQYSSRYDAFKDGKILPAFDPTKSGGALMDLNIYNINFMVGLFGEPLKVNYQANMERGIDTSGILTLDYGTFKAVCIAAKDCKAPIMSSIQGDKGCIVIDSSSNIIKGFQVLMNKSDSKQMQVSHENVLDYNDKRHRMYYEFIKFEEVFKNKDFDFVYKMLDISLITMDIQTKARADAGIIFDADNK